MINPNKITADKKRENNQTFAGGKYYLSVLAGTGYARACRRIWKRASEALGYAERVKARWLRLYESWGEMVLCAREEMLADLASRELEGA